MNKAHQLIQEGEHYFAKSGRAKYYPLVIDHGYGATLVDIEGKTYIGLLSSASSQNIGHTPREVTEAIRARVDRFIRYTPAYMHHEPLIRLVRKLCEIAPGDSEKRMTPGLAGPSANDSIVKFARVYTGHPYVISFTNTYRGSTLGSLSMSAISLNMHERYGPLLNGFHHTPFPDKYRGIYEQPRTNSIGEYLALLKEMFAKCVPADEVTCIVAETIQGDDGPLEPVPRYFETLEKICRKYDILIAVDDIQQGLGRAGTWSSVSHFNFIPDLITFGKSLTGGVPMSATIGRKEIMNCLEAPAHLFTTGANPVGCEVALTTIQTVEDQSLPQANTEKRRYVRKRMGQWVSKYNSVGDVKGKGLSIGIGIISSKKLRIRDANAALRICSYCFEHGVAIIAVAGSVLQFQPPLVVTYEQLDTALSTTENALTALEAGNLDQYDISGQGW